MSQTYVIRVHKERSKKKKSYKNDAQKRPCWALDGRRWDQGDRGWVMDGWMSRDKRCMNSRQGLDGGNNDPYNQRRRGVEMTQDGNIWVLWGVTCVWGRGRPKVEGLVAGRPTLLLSSSSALVSCSNCTSCSLTDSSRAAALSHCSIHTTQPQGERRGRYTHAYSPKTGYSSGRGCITKTHSPNRVQRDPADAWFEWGGGYPQILLGN